MSKPILANRLYVPEALVSQADLEALYETHTFVETTCRKCPIFKNGERPSQRCFTCTPETPRAWNGYTGHLIQWSKTTIQGKPYYNLPIGDLEEVKTELGLDLSQALDKRCRAPMTVPISFKGKLYTGREVVSGKKMANQIGIVKEFWRLPHRSGIICAPPRTGKTVLGTAFLCAFKMKTLIIAHESILLRQFEKEIRRFTDINAQERMAGRKLMVFVQKESDLDLDVEIMLINYQKLITELGIQRVVKKLQKRFGLIEVDEIHRCGTRHYEGLLNRLDPAHRIGFSATPSRKDGKEKMFLRTLGPVEIIAKVDTLKPTIFMKPTTFKPKAEFKGPRTAYTKTCTWLSEQQDRNIDILRQVFIDLRADPNNLIVIPVMKILHAKTLIQMINKQARVNNTKKDEDWPEKLAEMLWRESDKEKVIADVTAKRIRVLVAIQKFVKEGTNIPPLSHYYQIFPQNNRVSTEQGTARILTPLDGKPDPVIRYWMDPIGICISCFRNTYADSFVPLGYKFADESRPEIDRLLRLERNPKTGQWEDPREGDKLLSMW